MSERPEQPPEGRLIAIAQKRARLSGREAAKRAGMSEGHWRAIVSGSRSISAGNWVPVRAPADTLAQMAKVVGVSPTDLESVDRADAAEELRLLGALRRDPATLSGRELDQATEEAWRDVLNLLEGMRQQGDAEGIRRAERVIRALRDEDEAS